MIIARVIGNVVATQKHASHEGKKILLIQPLDLDDQPMGDVVVALDAVDAGIGDRVLAVQEGFSAMTSVGHTESPIDAAVIGVVDTVELT
jgi:ethanolamine utilization protein EutN